MFKKIALALVAIVAVFLLYVAIQSPNFRVARTGRIAAAPEAVFPHVNDFHKWDAWSPWAKLDPKAKNTFSGPDSGKGAHFAWDGNHDVGAGSMTITESKPSELILIQLDFIKPMQGTNVTEFTFKPEGKETVVTWTMTGESNFIGRLFCTFMNMDKMVGGKFDEGLASLKKIVESEAK